MLHNLLTQERKKLLRADYLARAATVAALALIVSVAIGALALVPAYFYLTEEIHAADATSDEQDTKADDTAERHATLVKSAALLTQLGGTLDEEQVTAVVSDAFAARVSGIAITGLAYDRGTHQLTLHGVAADRNALVSYTKALEQSSRFTNVPLPIADLAKNADLPFQFNVGIATSSSPVTP